MTEIDKAAYTYQSIKLITGETVLGLALMYEEEDGYSNVHIIDPVRMVQEITFVPTESGEIGFMTNLGMVKLIYTSDDREVLIPLTDVSYMNKMNEKYIELYNNYNSFYYSADETIEEETPVATGSDEDKDKDKVINLFKK